MSSMIAVHLAGGACPLLKPARRTCQVKTRRFFTYRRHSTSTHVRCQAGDEQNVTPTVQPTPPPLPTLPLPPPPSVPVAPLGEPVVPMPADPAAAEYIYRQQAAFSQLPPGQREYYMQPPPGYPYMPPPAPAPKAAPTGGVPWWIWFGLGMVVIKFIDWIQEVMRKGPQQYMTEMAMKQMMNAMQNPSAPGSSPFGGPFGGAAPPFPGAAPPFGAGSPFPFPPTPPPAQPAYDTTASTVQASAAADSRPGEKFTQRLSTEGRTDMPPPAAGATGTPLEVVEPVVKEPTSSSQTATGPSASAFFQDINVNEPAQPSPSASASSNGAATTAQEQQAGQGSDMSAVTTMMEKMLRNPEMQKMLYPYLPEPMRNPQSIEWMLNNPEVKKQMETMLQQQGFNLPPQMMDMMKNMDLSEDKVNRQFQELGLKPEDVISKVMSNPELAAGFADPKVQQAILDITQSPMNIVKYQNDPQIMRVLEKINEIFAPSMPGAAQGYPGAPPPGFPSYPGQMPPGYPGQMPPGYPGQMPPGYPGQAPPQENPSAPKP